MHHYNFNETFTIPADLSTHWHALCWYDPIMDLESTLEEHRQSVVPRAELICRCFVIRLVVQGI